MTISPASERSRESGRRGFTLSEVMIGASLGTVVLLGVLSTYLMLLRSGVNAAGYAVMEAQSRRAFEQFGIDARMASNLSSATNSVTLTVPNNYTATSNKVTYGYDSTNRLFYLVPGNGTTTGQTYVAPGSGTAPTGQQILIGQRGSAMLVCKVTTLTFNRYDSTGTAVSTDTAATHLQLKINVSQSGRSTVTVDETILSAAFTMRNKI